MPRYELAPVRHVAQRDESGQSRQVAEPPGRDDPPQVSLRHAQIASDLGGNWLGGDRWSLLIVRDAMDGARAFTDFQQRTGIARNILTDRLRRLVERGILDRQAAPRAGGSCTPSPRPGGTCSPSSSRCGSGANGTPSPRTKPTPSSSMNTVYRFRNSGRLVQVVILLTLTRRLCGRIGNVAALSGRVS
jgi:hypothetical protein